MPRFAPVTSATLRELSSSDTRVPLHDRGCPCHAKAESTEQECVAGLDSVIANCGVEGDRNGGRRVVCGVLDRDDRTLHRQADPVCDRFDVPLAAAALSFPLAHPAVVSVIPGLGSAQRVAQTMALYGAAIPSGFWSALRGEGLVRADAPLPEGHG